MARKETSCHGRIKGGNLLSIEEVQNRWNMVGIIRRQVNNIKKEGIPDEKYPLF